MTTNPTFRCSSGFTLVELLVVIAILATLASLLLPSLSMARDKARTATCFAHIRNLPMAAMVYAQDNNDFLVPCGKDSNNTLLWPLKLQDYLSVNGKKTSDFAPPLGATRNVIWGCTAWKGRLETNGLANSTSPGYGMNRQPLLPDDAIISTDANNIHVDRISHTSTRIFFADGDHHYLRLSQFTNGGPTTATQMPGWKPIGGPRHRGGMVIAFFDGHVGIQSSMVKALVAMLEPE